MIRRIVDDVSRLRHSVQYEVQRMTHKGGWYNYYERSFNTPEPDPNSDEDIQLSGHEEGKFRCIRRKNGRIDSVLWQYETDGAETWYEESKREEAQRERLSTMDTKEVYAELRTRSLDCLTFNEVMMEFVSRRDPDVHDEGSADSTQALVDDLVRGVAEHDGYKEALVEYREMNELE